MRLARKIEAPTRLALHHTTERFTVQCVTVCIPYSCLYIWSLHSWPRCIVYIFVNLFGSFEPIHTAVNCLEKMQTIPGIFLWSSCPIFASVELSTIADQIQLCGRQHNYILFLFHLPAPLPLAHQNGSGKAQTVIRLLLIRGKSSEPSFPSLCVLCNLSDTELQCSHLDLVGDLHPRVLHWSRSATPLLHFEITYFWFRWGQLQLISYFPFPLKMGDLESISRWEKLLQYCSRDKCYTSGCVACYMSSRQSIFPLNFWVSDM